MEEEKKKNKKAIDPFAVTEDEEEYIKQKEKWDIIFSLYSSISDVLINQLDKQTLMDITILDKDGEKLFPIKEKEESDDEEKKEEE